MNSATWAALVPFGAMVVVAASAVTIVVVALKGTAPHDRAGVLKAAAEVIRAMRGGRR